MAKMRIIGENFADSVTLTADPVVPTSTPLTNMQTASRSKVVRTLAYGEVDHIQDFMGDFVPIKAVSALVIGRHNMPTGTNINFKLYSDPGQLGTVLYDSGTLTLTTDEAGGDPLVWGAYAWGSFSWGQDNISSDEFKVPSNWVHWLPTIINSCRSFKLSIEVTNREIEIGRLIIGNYIEPTYNFSLGHTLAWKEDTKQYRTDGGTLRSDISIPVRELNFDLNTINESDRSSLQYSMRYVGLRRDFYISLFPDSTNINKKTDYSGIVKLTKSPSMQEYAPSYYKSKYIMEEV